MGGREGGREGQRRATKGTRLCGSSRSKERREGGKEGGRLTEDSIDATELLAHLQDQTGHEEEADGGVSE